MARKTNCMKNGKAYFRITAVIGYDEKGKPKRKEFYGSCQSDAEARRNEYLNGIKNGLMADASKYTLGQLCKVWIYEVLRVSDKLKPASFERYEGIYRKYIQGNKLSDMRVLDIKSLHIQRYYNRLQESGKTQSQIQNLHKVLRLFFNYAVGEGYIIKNPCGNLTIPGVKKLERKIEVFTDKELALLKANTTAHRLRFAILLDLGTGLRLGELLALNYGDISKDGTITVNKSLSRTVTVDKDGNRTWKLEVKSPKTKAGIRQVPVPPGLMKELSAHKAMQAQERMSLGLGKNTDGFIFTTATGNPYEASNFRTTYKRLLKRIGVPYRKFHVIRHTYATRLILAGAPLKTVQELMGHSDISITMIYAHSGIEDKKKAADMLNELFI